VLRVLAGGELRVVLGRGEGESLKGLDHCRLAKIIV
jgi:hypothetical protein